MPKSEMPEAVTKKVIKAASRSDSSAKATAKPLPMVPSRARRVKVIPLIGTCIN